MSNKNAEWLKDVKKAYEPISRPTESHATMLPPNISNQRTAHAAEYSAYQLGQISKKLDRLIEAVEKLAAKP